MSKIKGIVGPCLFLLLATYTVSQAQAAKQDDSLTVENVSADRDRLRVRIADPFLELRTGPAAGYPVFHVVDRGAEVTILRRKTNWFRIETDDGKSGWASRDQMRQTLLPDGEKLAIADLGVDDFLRRDRVLGFTTGEFEAAPVFTIFGAWSFTENLAGEMHFGQSVGNKSSSQFFKGNLVMQPMPEWEYSPYLTLGMGRIRVDPGATLIVTDEKENSFAQFGLGVQTYISRSFLFRFEVNEYVIFSTSDTRNENEEVNEWKFGFAVFF